MIAFVLFRVDQRGLQLAGILTRPEVSKPRPISQGHRPSAKAKAKAKIANVNCLENATVNLLILSHFRYSVKNHNKIIMVTMVVV